MWPAGSSPAIALVVWVAELDIAKQWKVPIGNTSWIDVAPRG